MRRLTFVCVLFAALWLAVGGIAQMIPQPAQQVWMPVEPQVNVSVVPDVTSGPSHTSHAAILFERTTGTVLFGTNMHQRRAPASLTKVMTAILTIEHGRLDDIVTVSRYAAGTRGSSAQLYTGQEIPLRTLLHGLLLRSGNDAAIAIAEHISGSEEAFVARMNQRASELGLENTQFQNPHGLDATNHYSTAYDLALLTDIAMNYPLFAEIVSMRQVTLDSGSTWQNTNRLLWQMQGVEGVKTGTTGQAGNCLIAAIAQEGMQLISVVLSSSNRWNDSQRILKHGFENFQKLTLVERGDVIASVPIAGGMHPVVAVADRPLSVVVRSDRPTTVDLHTRLAPVRAPIHRGDAIGAVEVTIGPDGMTYEIPVVAGADVARRTPLRVIWEWLRDR